MADTSSQKTTIAGYEIIEKVGQGGMGAVFKARQITMDRIVALKILPKRLAADPKYKDRFFREARMSAKLNHLNIVNAIDCGEDGGYTYFAMEFVEGRTAKGLLKELGKVPVDQAVSIVKQIAEALRYANTQQLIHRDIKPDNIMLMKDGTAKLLDLGLAKSTGNSEDSSLTQAGQAVGTPHYISPEQARGEADVDTRSDIYSLGATFYHLLTGKTPFPEGPPATVMARHLVESAPPVTELNPDVPEDWAAIVSKTMAKDPKERYADFSEFLADVEAVKNGVVPSAMNFRGKTSCTMPARVKPGKRGVGGTTGMKAPIRPASTTGPRAPVMARSTTGPNSPVGPRNPTGLSAPIGGRTAAREHPRDQGGSSPALFVGLGFAAVLLVGLLVFAMGGKKPEPPPSKPQNVAQNTPPPPSPVSRPAAPPPASPTAIKSTPGPVPVAEPEAPAAPPPPDPAVKQPAPGPVPPPPDPEVKPPEPGPAPVAQPEPVKPAGPDPAVEAAHAKFLAEVVDRARKMDLAKLADEARDLAKKPDYSAIKDETAAEIKDIERASKLENAGLSAIGGAKGEIDLPEDFVKRFKAAKGKIEKYEAGRGLFVNVGGVGVALNASMIPPQKVVSALPAPAPFLDAASYWFARGVFPETLALVPKLPETDGKRFARKLDLLKEGEGEFKARAAFDALAALYAGKQYKPFMEKAAEFQKEHAESKTAKEKAADLAKWMDAADQILNPNPWPKILHAKECKLQSDGFLEVFYDFSTAEQAKDFTGEHANPSAENGWLTVPPFGGEFSHAKFIAPFAAVKRIEAVGKTLQQRQSRFGVYLVSPGAADWNMATKMILRPYNNCTHLENWDPPYTQPYRNGGGQNFVGSKVLDWTKDTSVLAEGNGKDFKWTVGGEELPPVKAPDNIAGGVLAFVAWNGEHAWTKVRIVFKPEAAWAKQQLDALKAGKP